MPEQSLSSKYFGIIVFCVLKQQASSSESNNHIYCVSSSCSEVEVNYVKYENYWYLGATVYQKVTILFSLTHWMETVLYSHMFYAIFQFCTYV